MISAKAVKATAKTILKGNFVNAIIISVIPVLITAILYMVSYLLALPLGDFSVIILAVGYLFLLSPLFLGALRCFWRMANETDDLPIDVFYYLADLEKYKRAVTFTVKMTVRIFFFSFLFFLPSIIVQLLTNEWVYELFGVATPIWVLSFSPVFYVLRFAGIVALAACLMSMFLPAFLLVADEKMSVNDCIKRGIEIGRLGKNNFASIVFSFLGWILLSFFAIPLIFTAPYLLMSYIVTCRFFIARHNLNIDKLNEIPTLEI